MRVEVFLYDSEEAGRADPEETGSEPVGPELWVDEDEPVDRVSSRLDAAGWLQTHLEDKKGLWHVCIN